MKQEQTPVQKNQIVDVTIEDLTHEGSGVAKVNGFTLFIPKTLPGERAKIKVIKIQKGYGYGRLLEHIEKSETRTEPLCPIFDQCGGCQLQHLQYNEQLEQKQKMVENVMKRIGHISTTVLPTIGMSNPWRYRNKAQVPVSDREGGLVTGFYRKSSHQIVEMESCLIQYEENDKVVQTVKEIAETYGVKGYDELNHRGILRHVVVRSGAVTGDVMVVLITKGNEMPRQRDIVNAIKEKLPNVKSIIHNVNSRRTNVIFGEKTKVLWGDEYIYDYIGEIKFAISARSFYQVNPEQTKVLYDKALEFANLSGHETVIDAYCGIGTISLFLAQKAKQVYGVEIVPEAISDAKRNAELNGISNATFAVGQAEKVIPWWYSQGVRADCIVVDPPRKGCDAELLETILKMKPKQVVYVSCNPSTLARDLRILEEGGYKTTQVQPVDMFPMTMHVECVAQIIYQGG